MNTTVVTSASSFLVFVGYSGFQVEFQWVFQIELATPVHRLHVSRFQDCAMPLCDEGLYVPVNIVTDCKADADPNAGVETYGV